MKDFAKDRIGVLDGLRALAILLVLMRHSIRAFWLDISGDFARFGPVELGSPFINGWIGVDLFFVLSGFLITSHLLDRHFDGAGHCRRIGNYFKRRFFRIAPAYYMVLTLVCVGALPFFPYPQSFEGIGWRYVYHLAFLQDYLPSDIVAVFWSLAVEIKFYLLAPFLLWGLLRFKRPAFRFGMLGLLLALQPVLRWMTVKYGEVEIVNFEDYFIRMRNPFHICLDGLLAGTLCALMVRDATVRNFIERKRTANILFYTGGTVILFLLFAGPMVDRGVSLFDVTLQVSVVSVGFGAMMLGLLGGCSGYGLFQNKALTFIALISYSLYLVHLPMLFAAEIVLRQFIDFDAYKGAAQFFIYLPVFFGVSVFVSMVMYVFVEKPFIEWSRKS